MRKPAALIVALLGLLLAAAYGSSGGDTTPTPAPTPEPAATAAPALTAKPATTAKPAATAEAPLFSGIVLDISATDPTGKTLYEVHFRDSGLEAQRDRYSYSWTLDLIASACDGNSGPLIVATGAEWRASWFHPGCVHGEFERISVQVSRAEQSATMSAPTLGPAKATPP